MPKQTEFDRDITTLNYNNYLFADNLLQDQEIKDGLSSVFQLGFQSFFNGGRKPYYPNSLQKAIISKRAYAIRQNKPQSYIDKLAQQLLSQGLVCVDYIDTNDEYKWTKVEQVTIASNPYLPYTLMHKEWQRGWDKAYFISRSYQNERNKSV
jgi:hypothetical protein